MLVHALPDLAAGHEQHPLGARERGVQRGRIGVVGGADDDPLPCKVRDPLDAAPDGDDRAGLHATCEQVLDDEAPQVAGGAGDDECHELDLR